MSRDLTLLHGKGFSRSNLVRMRQLYLEFPISAKPSHLLSWSHYMNSQLFVQKYQLYLPEREELRRELEQTLREADV